MLNRFLVFALVIAAIAPSRSAHSQERPPSNDADELRKLGSTLDFIRQRNAPDYAISTPDGIDDARYLTVGGIEQWVTIRAEDRANPVVPVLHGGPGDTTNPWGHAVFRSWLKTYTVVQWDQRGAGRTLGRNGAASAGTLTINQLVEDGVESRQMSAAHASLAGEGGAHQEIEFEQDTENMFYGARQFCIRDLNGYELYFIQSIESH